MSVELFCMFANSFVASNVSVILAMPQKHRQQPENKPSSLLSPEENQQIFALLGPKCITIATAVVQLFCTKGPHHSYWVKQDTGVFCFIKDNHRKNYYFRLYCLRRSGKIWEHEIYNNMEYKCSSPFLHSFEGDKCIFAFNFACLDEADEVKRTVIDKLRARRISAAQKEAPERVVENKIPLQNVNLTNKVQNTSQGKKKKHKRRLTKAEIGNPTEFRHITKVKFDFDKGLDVDTSDRMYMEIFKKAGFDEKMLENRKTREFVFDFIENHPNMKKVAENMQSAKPIPTRMAPKPPQNRLPPPPPRRDQQPHIKQYQNNEQSSAPPNFAPPPPPPPPRPPSLAVTDTGPPLAPPPPPPPPLLSGSELPSTGNGTPTSKSPDMRSALLESIRQGKSLKPVSSESKESEPSRNDLLRQIKGGVALKPPSDPGSKSPTTSAPIDEVTDIAMALKKAIEIRGPAMRSDDSDTGTTSDDEWDA